VSEASTYIAVGFVFHLLAIFVCYRRTETHNPALGQVLFNLGLILSLQMALWQSKYNLERPGTAAPYLGLEPFAAEAVWIISNISFVSLVGVVLGGSARGAGRLTKTAIADRAGKIARSPFFVGLNVSIAVVLLLHFLVVDKEKLIYFEGYLSNSAYEMGIRNEFLALIQRSFGILNVILGVLVVISIKAERMRLFALCNGPAFFYCFIWELGSNSRFAAAVLSVIYLTKIALTPRTSVISHILFLAGILFTMHTSLEGRAYLAQGIGPWFERAVDTSPADVIGTIGAMLNNIFDGAVVLAATIMAAPSYESPYTWLSFLPSISLLDGFDSIQSSYAYNLASYVPVNAIGEAYFFGFPYWPLFLFLIGVLSYLYSRVCAIMSGPKSLVLVGIGYYIILAISEYSIRTSSRIIYLEIALMAGALALQKRVQVTSRAHQNKLIKVPRPTTM
jgi:hypothetical protein